jgi:hypothetical protein
VATTVIAARAKSGVNPTFPSFLLLRAARLRGVSVAKHHVLGVQAAEGRLRASRPAERGERRRDRSARKLAEETLLCSRQAEIASVEADTLHVLSQVAFQEGRMQEAFELQRRSLDIHRGLGGVALR